MGNFKMKAPFKWDPISIHEVPFDDPNLMGKANKNGTIIMNKDQAKDPVQREKIKRHEKHHLKEMLIDKNPDGSPKLDYDAESVSYKGVRYPRSEFNEGNKGLPWEKDAYGADKDIDFTDQLKSAGTSMIGGKKGRSDEDEVSMGESFGPSSRGFMNGPRGRSNPFSYMEDQGLLGHGVEDGIDGGPGSYSKPKQAEATPTDWSELSDNVVKGAKEIAGNMENKPKDEEVIEDPKKAVTDGDNEKIVTPMSMKSCQCHGGGPSQIEEISADPGAQALSTAQQNMQNSAWVLNEETGKEERRGTGTVTTPGSSIPGDPIPDASGGGKIATDRDKYLTKLKSDYPHLTKEEGIAKGYFDATAEWSDPEKTKPTTVTKNVFEEREVEKEKEIEKEKEHDGGGDGGGGNTTFEDTKKKNKKWNINLKKILTKKGGKTNQELFSCNSNTGECKNPGNVDDTIVKSKSGKRSSYGKTKRKAKRSSRKYRKRGGLY